MKLLILYSNITDNLKRLKWDLNSMFFVDKLFTLFVFLILQWQLLSWTNTWVWFSDTGLIKFSWLYYMLIGDENPIQYGALIPIKSFSQSLPTAKGSQTPMDPKSTRFTILFWYFDSFLLLRHTHRLTHTNSGRCSINLYDPVLKRSPVSSNLALRAVLF